VSDRDYLVELGGAAALLMVHLSRLSEEIISFVSTEFGFLELADEFCTGSSIMPQKKNPDVLELVRGKAATVIGNATSLLTLMKALPLGYNKDTQEDKTAWFSALDACVASVDILADVMATARPRAAVMAKATRGGHVLATEYANYLVRKGLPFREAHAVVGGLVREAVERGVDVSELPLEAFQRAHALFAPDVQRLDAAEVVRLKNSVGSCGDAATRELFEELERVIAS
jgi:argininosuccinate lyase